MSNPVVAISVLHYAHLQDTLECLRSLKSLDYPNITIFVVNNDVKEHAALLVEECGNSITLIQNETNVGFAEGQNIALRAALKDRSTDAVLVLNNDTTVEPSSLSEMVSQNADMVAPRTMQMDNPTAVDNLGIMVTSTGLPFNRMSDKQPLFCPSGGCALYSRGLLERAAYEDNGKEAYFDPAYFAYLEDFDLGWRARNCGFTAGYAPNAIVYHKGSASTGKLSDVAVYHSYRNLIWTQYKNLTWPFFIERSPLMAAGWISLLFYYLLKGRPLALLHSMYAGLQGLASMSKRRAMSQKMICVSASHMRSLMAKGIYPRKQADSERCLLTSRHESGWSR